MAGWSPFKNPDPGRAHSFENFCDQPAVLPTGRLFGRISQKGLNNKWSVRTILQPIFADFEQKGLKRAKIGGIVTKLFPSSYPF
jgi:hypothetical protein